MLRVLFLILILMSSVAFAQIENEQDKPKAFKFDEIGKVNQFELKKRIKIFRGKLEESNSSISYVYIINYGKAKDVALREKALRNYLFENCRDCYGFGGLRMTFIRGNDKGELKTVFWIVPIGAEAPNLDEEIK